MAAEGGWVLCGGLNALSRSVGVKKHNPPKSCVDAFRGEALGR